MTDRRRCSPSGGMNGKTLTWADTHHPGLSETNGEYDGQFLFINDKANARMAVIDLRDFETKQIVKNPLIISNHGGAFVTPNTEYIIDGSQYAAPLGWEYAPLSDYKNSYRGAMTFWKFDRETGRIDPEPVVRDRAAALLAGPGRRRQGSERRLVVLNSLNTEMALGGIMEGKPPVEAGASQRDMDYLHVINWRKAAEVIANGGGEDVKGMKVIRMADAVANGLVFSARAEEPARRRRHPGRQVHGRRRQARPARHHLQLREDQGRDRGRRLLDRRVRRAGPRLRDLCRGAGGARPRPAAHAVRRQGPRLHQSLPRQRGRQVEAGRRGRRRWLEAGREDPGPLQHRPHHGGRGRHGQPRTASTWSR